MGEVIELSEATKVADVVPVWDWGLHEVPGGYGGRFTHDDFMLHGPDPWLAIDTAEYPRRVACPCYPSVQTHREGTHIGAVVVHHAFDGRTSGSSA